MAGPEVIKVRNHDVPVEELMCAPENIEGRDPKLADFLLQAASKNGVSVCHYKKGFRESLLVVDNTPGVVPAVGYYDLGTMCLPITNDLKDSLTDVLPNHLQVDLSGKLRQQRRHETGGFDIRALDFPIYNRSAAGQLVAEEIDKKRQEEKAKPSFQQPQETETKALRFASIFRRNDASASVKNAKKESTATVRGAPGLNRRGDNE